MQARLLRKSTVFNSLPVRLSHVSAYISLAGARQHLVTKALGRELFT